MNKFTISRGRDGCWQWFHQVIVGGPQGWGRSGQEWLRGWPGVVWIVGSGAEFVIMFTICALPGSRRRSLPGRRLGLTSF